MDSSSRSPITAWTLISAVLIGGIFYVYGKKLEAKPQPQTPPSITVTGDGKISAPPDIAELSFGVQTGRQRTAKDAIAILQRNMDAVLAAVKAAGIPEKDIKTQYFSLSPEYDWTNSGQIPRGFAASQSLIVKVRDLDKVGDVLTAATGAGANQAGNVSFTIDDPEKLTAQARDEAIGKAKTRAETIAKQLGMKLGKVTSFTEGGGYNPPVLMRAQMDMADAKAESAAGIAMPAGEQDVTTQVTITYELQ